ncbi:carbohydrate ABC transporter permease, partial [Candidatus Aerophobetes bacterium]|nr:carbohydrate ABC transporter permease [Candidatus Aerophobetes bacterium]
TFLILLTSSLAGYVFAKFNFKYKEFFFTLLLSTMMIPFVVIMIPLYILASDFNWINRFSGLIIPMGLSAFGIFLMRQFIENIPSALLEAARIDGASEWWIYIKVIVPLSLPALSALSIFSFMWSWNNLLWPLLIVNSKDMQTITLAIASLQWQNSIRYDVVITGAAVSVIPVLIVYAFTNRTFIRGLTLTGLKY